jgi:flagellar hook-associated protein 2
VANAVSGVGSIDVATIVSQLMTAEQGTKKLLTTRQTSAQTTLSVLQGLNTRLASVQTAAETIITSALVPRPWSVNKVTSSSTSVTGTASGSATPGSYSVDVQSVAASHSVLFDTSVSSTAAVGGGSLTIAQGSSSTTVDLSNATSITDVAKAINGTSGLGVKASVLKVGTDAYRLQLTSTTAGAASQFTVSGASSALGGSTVATTGADTVVKYGPSATDVATSSSTTVTDLFPGVSFTVSKPETGITLTVGQDVTAMTSQVQQLVSAANAVITGITGSSTYDAATKTAGPLLGSTLAQSIKEQLGNSIFTTTGTPASSMGISMDKKGQLTVDAAAFQSAITSNPSGVVTGVQAFATTLGRLAQSATRFGTGSVTQAITDQQSAVKDVSDALSRETDKLATKQAQLTSQYSTLNTTLGKLNNQASWVSAKLSALASGSTTG